MVKSAAGSAKSRCFSVFGSVNTGKIANIKEGGGVYPKLNRGANGDKFSFVVIVVSREEGPGAKTGTRIEVSTLDIVDIQAGDNVAKVKGKPEQEPLIGILVGFYIGVGISIGEVKTRISMRLTPAWKWKSDTPRSPKL